MSDSQTMTAGEWFTRGTDLAKVGRFEEAVSFYNHTLKLEPNHAKALFNRGVCLKNLRRYQEALESFKKAQRIDPTDKGVQPKLVELEALIKREAAKDGFVSIGAANESVSNRLWLWALITAVCGAFLVWAVVTAVTSRTAPKPITPDAVQGAHDTVAKADFSPPAKKETEIVSNLKNDYSMTTGNYLVAPKGANGAGKLDLDNGSTQDAVVKVAYEGAKTQTFCIVYIQMGGRVHLTGLPTGSYRVLAMIGSDWEPFRYGFRLVSVFSRTPDTLKIGASTLSQVVSIQTMPADSIVTSKDFLEKD